MSARRIGKLANEKPYQYENGVMALGWRIA